MAYVIGTLCDKSGDCLLVCPTDSIHPKPTQSGYNKQSQLYINPATCSECGNCVSACPRSAIFPDFDVPAGQEDAVQANRDYYGE